MTLRSSVCSLNRVRRGWVLPHSIASARGPQAEKHRGVRAASLDGKRRQSCQRLKSAVVFSGVGAENMSDYLVPPRTSRWGTAAATATGLPRPVPRTLPFVPCRSGDPGRWPIAMQAEKRGIAEGQAHENHALTGRCGPVAVTAAVRIARAPEPVFEAGRAALQ